MESVKIPSSKPYINFYSYRITEATFGAERTTSEKL